MNEIKQASIYMRVLWFNDNEDIRPDSLNIKLEGENTEEVNFSISKEDKNTGKNSPWNSQNEWTNGITYNYQKEPQEPIEGEEQVVSNIPYVVPSVVETGFYRCNILKNVETEEYSYYTIKMTFIPPKINLMSTSTTGINVNGTSIENVKFNGVDLDKVYFNNTLVFEKKTASFKDLILANSVVNEEKPDFSLTATTDEGMFKDEDNDGISYYFRGAVTNNWVKFAGFWWRIIRINGDNSIRLICNGTTNGLGTQIETSPFNGQYNNNAYVGYMYTSGQVHGLESSSTIKGVLDTWYITNIVNKGYSGKLDTNAGFWGDREISSGSGIGKTKTNYASSSRVGGAVTYKCAQDNDLYTVSSSNKGNKALSNPIGLITSDEVMFAGGFATENINYYLYTGQFYWMMSPANFNGTRALVFDVSKTGNLTGSGVSSAYGVRPVINLRNDIAVTGTGTSTDPYIVVGAE